MRELSILVFVVLVVGRVEPLSNYCSAVNRTELVGKLETCYNLKSLDVTASTTTTTSTTSQPASTITRPPSTVASSSNTNQLSLDQVFNHLIHSPLYPNCFYLSRCILIVPSEKFNVI